MKSVLVRFAPSYTPLHPRDHMIERLDRFDEVPVRINHDAGRIVGRVKEIQVLNDNYGKPWFHALLDVTDAPEWLERGSGVSFGAKLARTRYDMGVEIVCLAMLQEITLLDPSRTPADSQARVISVSEDEPRPGPIIRRSIGRVLGVR